MLLVMEDCNKAYVMERLPVKTFMIKANLFLVLYTAIFTLNFFITGISFAEFSVTDSSGFVVLTDIVPDAIMEMRYYGTYNFIGERVRGYEEPVALVTRETANALREVNNELLPMGYTIKVFDAYRPQMAVDHFVEWAKNVNDVRMQRYFYPEEQKENLFAHGYIASRSGHSRGSTVDLTLYNLRKQCDVDMGGTFDFFGYSSHPDYPHLTVQQKHNRQLLRSVMIKHGFRGINTEWWHLITYNIFRKIK